MKVSELMAKLQEIEGDPVVIVIDSEDGCSEVAGVTIVKSRLTQKNWYWSGDEYIEADNCVMVE